MKSLLTIMKFVYHYADVNDLENLYKNVEKTGLPVKQFDATKALSKVLRPLAVSDYLKDNEPLEPIEYETKREAFEKAIQETNFIPVITDADICSSYNAKSMLDVFNEESVNDFHDIFNGQKKVSALQMANKGEYTFVVDTQSRREFPFHEVSVSKKLAR